MNLFRMVSIKKVVKLTHFEKNRKNTFLVNAKKWKKWEKWSSKWNHQKVALTNCHYFVNSDPHAKIEEVLTRRFVERESFQQKGTCIIFIVLLHGRGPYPSLIAFFATRDHLVVTVAPLYSWLLRRRFRGGRSRGTLNALAKGAPFGCSFLLESFLKRYLMNFVRCHKSNNTKRSVCD